MEKAHIFNENSTRNTIIFGVDNSSLSHTDNLGKEDTFCINESFGAPEKKLILILVKQR